MERDSKENYPSNRKFIGAMAAAFVVASLVQTTHEVGNSKREIGLTDPISWVAVPLADTLEAAGLVEDSDY